MKTAKEYLKAQHKDRHGDLLNQEEALIEFAKMHVEAALKEAGEKAQAYQLCKDSDPIVVSKDSILNAYPLENIK